MVKGRFGTVCDGLMGSDMLWVVKAQWIEDGMRMVYALYGR